MHNKRTIPRTCQQCGKDFLAVRQEVEKGNARFCSRSCADRRHSLPDLFWKHVEKHPLDACWIWTGSKNPHGYGQIGNSGKVLQAHRVAWEIVGGPIPDGICICHACDNPSCVRNDDEGFYELNGILYPRRGHLWLGTNADNVADRVAKNLAAKLALIEIPPLYIPPPEKRHW